MPKPNQKRIEARQYRPKTAGKLYIPDFSTVEDDEVPAPDLISDDELERELTKLLSSDQGYGKNYGKSLRRRP